MSIFLQANGPRKSRQERHTPTGVVFLRCRHRRYEINKPARRHAQQQSKYET